MNHKVLLADDSLTIQKVIKITLANQPYDITDCPTENELFAKLPIIEPKLVFLDFNLSDKFTGYELCAKIKSLLPSAKILLLLGTFDSVDDAAMEKAGASDKIVKPFDSNKFIAICKQMIDTFVDDDKIEYPAAKKQLVAPPAEEEDQWTVNHTTEQKLRSIAPEPVRPAAPDMNLLNQEISDWGMSVPGVISAGSHDLKVDLPPVMDFHQEIKTEKKDFQTKFPENVDLDYPTIEEMTAKKEEPSPKAKSKLISIENFNDTIEPLELENLQNAYKQDESDVSSIEAQIRDEVEENLWQVDEFEELKKEVSSKIEEVKNNFQPSRNAFDESLFRPLDERESNFRSSQGAQPTAAASLSIDTKDIRTEMEALVKKHVKEYMDQMFQKNVEKISWEVIPDLAENLIRQELSKIASKILNEQN